VSHTANMMKKSGSKLDYEMFDEKAAFDKLPQFKDWIKYQPTDLKDEFFKFFPEGKDHIIIREMPDVLR